jgi:hypothetical protein
MPEGEGRARLEQWLQGHSLRFVEVKTLTTLHGPGRVKMTAGARERKERWEKKYQAKFVTVALDDRRSHHYSGNRLYVRCGTGSVRLQDMQKAKDFEQLEHLMAECPK